MTMRITKKGKEFGDKELTNGQVTTLLKFMNMTDAQLEQWCSLETREEVKEFLKEVEPYDLGRRK
jgi:hypothetical protein